MITVHGLSKRYGDFAALDDVSLHTPWYCDDLAHPPRTKEFGGAHPSAKKRAAFAVVTSATRSGAHPRTPATAAPT